MAAISLHSTVLPRASLHELRDTSCLIFIFLLVNFRQKSTFIHLFNKMTLAWSCSMSLLLCGQILLMGCGVKRLVFMALIIGWLSGCSAKYSTNNVQENTELLKTDTSVVIAIPVDGFYAAQKYAGSGNSTANEISSAFMKYSDKVTVSQECHDLNCLKERNIITQGYYVVPQILHWEDRATEWSGIPDKIEIKITIYNVESNSRIASAIISGKSKWATSGGDHPQDLLSEPVGSYISSLY